jgi:cytochrome c
VVLTSIQLSNVNVRLMRQETNMRALGVIILSSLIAGCSHLKTIHQTNTSSSAPEASSSPAALPSGRGTPAEAKAMMLKAIDHYNAVGRTKALDDFTKMKSPFGDRDLYVFCLGSNHRITANGGFAQYVGRSVDVMKDANGKSLGKAIWDAAEQSGEGSIEYMWINPVSQQTEHKVAYFKKVSDDVCGVGAYHPG